MQVKQMYLKHVNWIVYFFFQANVCYLISIKSVCIAIALLCLGIMSEVWIQLGNEKFAISIYSLNFYHLQNLNYFKKRNPLLLMDF